LSDLIELRRFIATGGPVLGLDIETCAAQESWDKGLGRPPKGYESTRRQQALSPFHGRIRAISLSTPDRDVCLVDAFAPDGTSQSAHDATLREVLVGIQGRCLISHNALFDATWLANAYGLRFKKLICTLTLSRLLTNGDLQARNDLGAVLERELGVRIKKTLGETDWSGPLSPERRQYMANDVQSLHLLANHLRTRIEENGLDATANLELSLLPLVVDLHCAGIRVHRERLMHLTREGEKQVKSVENEIRKRLGRPDLNVGSPIQLRTVLGLPATNRETLMAIEDADPNKMIASLILKWRESKKLTTTFTRQWAGKISNADRRVHPTFNPTGTVTGRFSCKQPNIQQAPRGAFRNAVIPEDDAIFVVADLSQIELRAVAAVSGDDGMVSAYCDGKDLHAETAAICLGDRLRSMPEKARAEARQLSKQVNFGFSYGMSPKTFRSKMRTDFNIDVSLGQATMFRRRYFAARPGLRQWHARAWELAHHPPEPCEVRTALGRRRFLPRDPASKWLRFSERVNTQIQGSCADALKFAMLDVWRHLPRGARLVWTLHDELGVECQHSQLKQVARLIGKALVDGFFKTPVMRRVFEVVPIQAEVYSGQTWEAKERKENKVLTVTRFKSDVTFEEV
jgi:DNA polymerase-1